MTHAPYLSVIVPVYQGRTLLPGCLESLVASELPREQWELIVVDDGSTDGSGDLARPVAAQVVRVTGGPKGPAVARNRGAEGARGEVLVFIDADTGVHSATLSRLARPESQRPAQAGRGTGGPKGPAVARSRGSEGARGEVLVFIDADTRVHSDPLSRFAALMRERPEVNAVFGAYDDAPAHPSFLSQYRNLLHRY